MVWLRIRVMVRVIVVFGLRSGLRSGYKWGQRGGVRVKIGVMFPLRSGPNAGSRLGLCSHGDQGQMPDCGTPPLDRLWNGSAAGGLKPTGAVKSKGRG